MRVLRILFAVVCLSAGSLRAEDGAAGNGVALGRPYSAVRYSLAGPANGAAGTMLPSGDEADVARDADGRIRIVRPSHPACISPQLRPGCPRRVGVLLEPAEKRFAIWMEGTGPTPGSTHVRLSAAQLAEIEKSQNPLSTPVDAVADDGSTQEASSADGKRSDLGTRTIEGVLAHGTRTIFPGRAAHDAAAPTRPRVRDVWFCDELQLTVLVEETEGGLRTVQGLKKISRSPAAELFIAPSLYGVYGENRDGGSASEGMKLLAEVPVR